MDGNTIPMFGPDGKLHDVSHDDADKALASGGERAILFHAPDGKQRYVKHSQFKDALSAGGFVANPEDLTINEGKEGLYKMAGPGGKQAPVPYSLVGSAAKLGYVMDQEDRKKYVADASADPALHNMKLRPGVKAVGRNSAGQVMVAPQERGDTPVGLTPTGTNPAGFPTYHGTPKQEPGLLGSAGKVFTDAARGFGELVDPSVTPEERKRQQQSGDVANTIEAVIPGAYIAERIAGQQVTHGQEAISAREKRIQEEQAAQQTTGPEQAKHLREAAQQRMLAAGHALSAIVPFTGPMAAGIGEEVGTQVGEGNRSGAAGTIIGNTALIAAPHLTEPLGHVLSNAVTSLPEGVRGGIRRTLGITDKTEDLINKFKDDSEKIRTQNEESDAKTLGKRGVVEKAREDAAKEHADALVEHERTLADLKQKHQDATAKRDLENENIRKKHSDLQKQTKAENEQALIDHFAELEKIARDRQAAQGVDNQRATWQKQVEDDSAELRARREKAEIQTQADDKAAWDAVRAKTAPYSTDISALQKITERAANKADPATSVLFKRIIKGEEPNLPALTRQTKIVRYVDQAGNTVDPMTMGAPTLEAKVKSGEYKVESVPETVNPNDEGYGDLYESQFGEPPPVGGGPAQFNRLQRWYSYISNKMYGAGRVEGGLYDAYKMVRSGINDAMQDIAKQANAVPDLDKAREIHTQRMETFVDRPTEKSNAANAYEKRVTPDEARDAAEEEWAQKLGRYDPEIPKLGERLKKTRAALKQLPTEAEVRKMMSAEPPTPPISVPVPPDLQPHEFKPPVEDPKYPEPPKPPDSSDEKFNYEEPENTKPLPDAQQVPNEVKHALNRGLRRYGAIGAWVLRSIVGGEALHLAHGSLSTFGSTMLLGQVAVSILTDALRRPKVLDWLAKPTAEDLRALDKLPPKDAERLRQALSVLAADEAKKLRGKLPPFDPTMSRFLLGASVTQGQQPTLEDLKKEADKMKPQQQAAPGPQSSAQQPNWTHEFNESTGKIEPVNA